MIKSSHNSDKSKQTYFVFKHEYKTIYVNLDPTYFIKRIKFVDQNLIRTLSRTFLIYNKIDITNKYNLIQ